MLADKTYTVVLVYQDKPWCVAEEKDGGDSKFWKLAGGINPVKPEELDALRNDPDWVEHDQTFEAEMEDQSVVKTALFVLCEGMQEFFRNREQATDTADA